MRILSYFRLNVKEVDLWEFDQAFGSGVAADKRKQNSDQQLTVKDRTERARKIRSTNYGGKPSHSGRQSFSARRRYSKSHEQWVLRSDKEVTLTTQTDG